MSNITNKTIKKIALELGFDDCGIAAAVVQEDYYKLYNSWLNNYYYADMEYLNKNKELRNNPKLLFEKVESVIVVLLNYNNEDLFLNKRFFFARYSYYRDYHIVIKSLLEKLLNKIKEIDTSIEGRCFVDSAPIFERYFAEKAGLGFIGRNNCLISEKFGSFVFIGEILINKKLEFDTPLKKTCLACNLCIEKCPTKALTAFSLDSNKCISYHTIENKKSIPDSIAKLITNQVFACDICQSFCPHNKETPKCKNLELNEIKEITSFDINDILNISNNKFKKIYKNTALSRITRRKLINNFKIVFRENF